MKFKVGDRVRVIRESLHKGRIGTVVVTDDKYDTVAVMLDSRVRQYFCRENIEHLSAVERLAGLDT